MLLGSICLSSPVSHIQCVAISASTIVYHRNVATLKKKIEANIKLLTYVMPVCIVTSAKCFLITITYFCSTFFFYHFAWLTVNHTCAGVCVCVCVSVFFYVAIHFCFESDFTSILLSFPCPLFALPF